MAARADLAIRPPAIVTYRRRALAHATPDWRIGFVEPRNHFTGAALARDPAEIVVLVQRAQILIRDQDAEAVRRHAAADEAVLAGGELIAPVHRAVRVLHRVPALVLEAPMRAVALHAQAR